jgi:hypothetical protein
MQSGSQFGGSASIRYFCQVVKEENVGYQHFNQNGCWSLDVDVFSHWGALIFCIWSECYTG